MVRERVERSGGSSVPRVESGVKQLNLKIHRLSERQRRIPWLNAAQPQNTGSSAYAQDDSVY